MISDNLIGVLNDVIDGADRGRLEDRLDYIGSLSGIHGYMFSGHDRSNISRACISVERCIGARNSKNAQLLQEARKQISQVQSETKFKAQVRPTPI